MRGVAAAFVLAIMVLAPISPVMGQEQDVMVRSDLRYGTAEGVPLLLDVFLPPGPGPHPGLMVIPGGQWAFKDKEDVRIEAQSFAERGFAAFAVSYRPATEYPYPAAVADIQTAVRWVRTHAAEFGVDPARLGAIGASSGGHLAAMLATLGEGPLDSGSRIAAAVSWSGPLDLPALLDDPAVGPPVRTFLGCSGGGACIDTAEMASPITYVDPTDSPVFIVNSTEEIIPFDQATRMAEVLDGSGVPYELRAVEGDKHGWSDSEKFMTLSIGFFDRWLLGNGEGATQPSPAERVKGDQLPPSGAPVAAPGSDEGRSTASLPAGMIALLLGVAAVVLVVGIVQIGVVAKLLRRTTSTPDAAATPGDGPDSAGADRSGAET